ncbi:hypothetical protein [Collinsella sp. AF16-8]|uniref:hypothetical protein n=1 Tax=Collinsella sp. AF16-8 TaxID=2292215 RepID=UPI000E480685|nr:hypothetical protein [Collinsella sp. AF16-8]RGU43136.1 hypothetical protein DWW73_05230 [Collinsella sp. AF16-8]
MAKKIPTFTSDTVSSACSDISKIVEAKSLNQKRLDHETSLEGALLIGRRLEQETAGYPITNLKGLLSPVGGHLHKHYGPRLGQSYLARCIKFARAVPKYAPFRSELDLAHYEALARVTNEYLRLELMNVAADNRWPSSHIALHARYQNPQHAPSNREFRELTANQEVWRFARAYTDACGIISLEKFVELYNSCAPEPVSIFEVNETIWKIKEESGRIDNPCILSKDGELYLIAPELDDTVENNPYYYDDYGYSYRRYERHSEYTQEMRSLRERRVQSRRAAIFTGHKQHPIEKLDYEDIVCGYASYTQSVNNLKLYILNDSKLGAASLHAREDEFDFIMAKLLRSIGLNGMPTAQQTTEDAEFLLIVVRPDFYKQAEINKVSKLLAIVYENTPLWEFNGRSYTELKSEKTLEPLVPTMQPTVQPKQAA